MCATLTRSVTSLGFEVSEGFGLPRPVAEAVASFRPVDAHGADDALAVREQDRHDLRVATPYPGSRLASFSVERDEHDVGAVVKDGARRRLRVNFEGKNPGSPFSRSLDALRAVVARAVAGDEEAPARRRPLESVTVASMRRFSKR